MRELSLDSVSLSEINLFKEENLKGGFWGMSTHLFSLPDCLRKIDTVQHSCLYPKNKAIESEARQLDSIYHHLF